MENINTFFCFLDGQRGEWGIVPSKYKVDEELLKRNIDSDSELGMGIAGSGVSVAGKTLIFWRVVSLLLKQPFNNHSHIAIVVRPPGRKTLCRSLVICKGFFCPATPAVI